MNQSKMVPRTPIAATGVLMRYVLDLATPDTNLKAPRVEFRTIFPDRLLGL